jgi:hypothetical protein
MKNRVIWFEFGLLVVCLLGYARYESTHRVVVDESIFREDFENDKKVINELLENKFVGYDEIEDVVWIMDHYDTDRLFVFNIGNKNLGVVGDSGSIYFGLKIYHLGEWIYWDSLVLRIDGKRKEYDMNRLGVPNYEYKERLFEMYDLEVKDIFGRSDLDEILGCDKIIFRMYGKDKLIDGKDKYFDGEIKGGELRKVKEMITLYRLIDKNKYFVGLDKLTKD